MDAKSLASKIKSKGYTTKDLIIFGVGIFALIVFWGLKLEKKKDAETV